MLVKRHCKMCATPFEARSKAALYCSERCKKRAQRAGAAAKAARAAEVQATGGTSGASSSAAAAWLAARGIDSEQSPAAADLLVVAGAIDEAKSTGQVQYIAALARQAAALRAELAPRADESQEETQEPAHAASNREPQQRSFDAAAI